MAAPRYGVDGWPYLVGLSGTAVAAGAGATGSLLRGRSARAGVLALVSLGAAVPALLGLRYVTGGKLRHRDRLLDRVTWRGDEVVLDVGAGAGLLGIGAARRVPQGRVPCVDLWVGKDLSGSGPDRLRRNATLEGVTDRLDIRTGDARALDLPDHSVDVVLSTLCLHNVSDDVGRRSAAREIARVLRPGGHAVLSDLGGTQDLVVWLTDEGLQVLAHEPAPGIFPPQKVLVAHRPVRPRGPTTNSRTPSDDA